METVLSIRGLRSLGPTMVKFSIAIVAVIFLLVTASTSKFKSQGTNPVSLKLAIQTLFHLLYNIFLHPLKRYPGPTLWAATRIPWCWWQYKGRLNQRLLDLHTQYGHTVRIAPNELSFTTDTAWKTIYGQRSVEMGKDPVFRLHTPTGSQSKWNCHFLKP